ncbi:MAG TPA: DUF2461 domain-containing protein [Streptosporangiaceae bacterium]|nr:DUF2461 domain-containing protein [Streptosporangiaceae bacterium]
MSFGGWPAEALDFYEGLEADNSKAYWTAHKAIYDEKVLGPMSELLEELAPEFGEAKIFRPYRDVRFSKDKSPYKTNISAVIGDGYLQLSAQGLAAGSGMYMMAPDQLDRYRQAVASDETGAELEQVIAGVEGHEVAVHGHDVLKTAPRGYPADHPRIALLRYKGVVAWKEWPAGPWLGTPAAKQRVTGFLAASMPLCAWLEVNVGESTAEPTRR